MKKSYKKSHKRKVRKDHMFVTVFVVVLAIALVSGGIYGVKKMFFTPPSSFTLPSGESITYNKDTKKFGEMKHITEDKENQYYLSFYYPFFNDKTLDDFVQSYKKELPTSSKGNGKITVFVDYDAKQVYKQYTTLTFHQKIYDNEGKLFKSNDTTFNYDAVAKKVMKGEDVLRRNYIDMMLEEAKKNGIKEDQITQANLNTFTINEKDTTFYVAGNPKQKITVNYEQNKQYIALKNENIPSLYQKQPIQAAKEPQIDPKKPMIAITFDDGPHGQFTQEIMSEFEKYNGRATFYHLGANVLANPTVTKDIVKRGFELGNHSWDHSMQLARTLTRQQVSDQIYNTQDIMYKLTGVEPKFFRPPYGAVNKTLLEANYLKYSFWDIDSLDWSSKNAQDIFDKVVAGAKNKNIVALIHDIHKPSMESVKKILPYLHEKGYQFVTYSTLYKYHQKYLQSLDKGFNVSAKYSNDR